MRLEIPKSGKHKTRAEQAEQAEQIADAYLDKAHVREAELQQIIKNNQPRNYVDSDATTKLVKKHKYFPG